jgi:prevent-host-death family protein
MRDISATDAARNFADVLNAVEHRGERFTIIRRGKAVAHLEPLTRGRGSDAKALLRRHAPDAEWRDSLDDVRSLLELDERR